MTLTHRFHRGPPESTRSASTGFSIPRSTLAPDDPVGTPIDRPSGSCGSPE